MSWGKKKISQTNQTRLKQPQNTPDTRTALRFLSIPSLWQFLPILSIPSLPIHLQTGPRDREKEALRKPQQPTADGARGACRRQQSPGRAPFPFGISRMVSDLVRLCHPLSGGRRGHTAVRKVTSPVASCGQAAMADLDTYRSPKGVEPSAASASWPSPPESCSRADSPVWEHLSTGRGEHLRRKGSAGGGKGEVNTV